MKKFNEKKRGVIKFANVTLKLFLKKRKKLSGSLHIADNCKRILVIDFNAIGDIVMLIPFLRVLKRNVPAARISLVCRPYAPAILKEQGLVDVFFSCENRLFSSKNIFKDVLRVKDVLTQINCHGYDIALEPRGDLRDIFFMHFCNAKRKAAYTYTGGEYMLTDPIEPEQDIKHLIDDKMIFLKKLGCHIMPGDEIPFLRTPDKWNQDNNAFSETHNLKGKYVIGIHPGASKQIKAWGKFEGLIKMLHDFRGDIVFLLFSENPDENEVIPLLKCVDEHKICYIHICESITEYMKRMALCNIVVCNDSGAAHIAAALGIDVHVIFGPVLSELSRPYSHAGVYVYEHNDISCRPCNQEGCAYGNRCLEEISVEEVFEGIIRVLDVHTNM